MTTTTTERAAAPPREMRRTSPFALVRTETGRGDGLTLDGYAAVFNRETVIDSWEGRFREKLARGAMKKSFQENPPRIQFDHGSHPLIGSIPIGAPEPGYPREETDKELAPEGGAHVIARLHDNWLIQPVRDAISTGSIDGMSFRFSVVSEIWQDADGKQIRDDATLWALLERSWIEDLPDDQLLLRTLKEVRVPELGPVVWPAYTDTSVGVRSKMTIDLGRLSDPDTRSALARAVFMADAAECLDKGTPAGTDMAASHVPEPPDAPQSTDSLSAGEHESAVARKKRDRLAVAAQYRGYLLTLPDKD